MGCSYVAKKRYMYRWRQLIFSPLSPTRGHETEEERASDEISTVRCLINTFVHAQRAVMSTPCTSVAQQEVVT